MWLVLTDAADQAGASIGAGLAARGLEPVEVVTAPELFRPGCVIHRVSTSGTEVRITLADGRVIGPEVRGTVNRLTHVPLAAASHLAESDRIYAQQELYALALSWLAALPGPMLNRPDPRGLGGTWRHPSEWAWRAGRAGLAVDPFVESTAGPQTNLWPAAGRPPTVVVVGNRVVGTDVPEAVAAGCLRLAEAAVTPLLGIVFDAGWRFIDANPRPDLDGAALDAVADLLSSRAEVAA